VVQSSDIPQSAVIYPTKFVLKKKRDAVSAFTSVKAGLVVYANWIQGVFRSLFAPTVNENTIAVIFELMMPSCIQIRRDLCTAAVLKAQKDSQ
jgi:hypothetical protein